MASDANEALPLHANRVAIIGAGNVGATARQTPAQRTPIGLNWPGGRSCP